MPQIEERVEHYLRDANENIYPWVELHLLRMLALAPRITDDTHASVWRILSDKNKDLLVREHAARCIGRHSRPGDSALLRALVTGSIEMPLRRAILVAYTEATGRSHPDKGLLGAVARDHPELASTCDFLRSPAVIPGP
jgi:hypothetical protein